MTIAPERPTAPLSPEARVESRTLTLTGDEIRPLLAPEPVTGPGEEQEDDARRPVNVPLLAATALLAGLAAAWLTGGAFREPWLARAVAGLGVVVGLGPVTVTLARPKLGFAQHLALPLAVVTGVALLAPAASGGTANVPELIKEVFTDSGLAQTPAPFVPGWRFVLVVLFAALSAASLGLAAGRGKPRLAVIVAIPLVAGSALLQPKGSEVSSSTVGIVLMVGALAVAYGADIAAQSSGSAVRFEARRLVRAAVIVTGLVAVMVGLAQTSFLFPNTSTQRALPPRKPPLLPLEKDRELFTVSGDQPGPWRLGVLDTYDLAQRAWLLPPVDDKLRPDLHAGAVPDAPRTPGKLTTTTFDIKDMKGLSLPVPAGAVSIAVKRDGAVHYDLRTGVPSLDDRLPQGLQYAVTAPVPPATAELNESPAPPPEVLSQFTALPPVPVTISSLLAQAPAKPFDRLQFLRNKLYANVTAAGSGGPIDITPARVEAMVDRKTDATPFEITAAEAMLARWGGLPARIGFGYFRGDTLPTGFSVRPKYGAAWLEVYFNGRGWVPLVGVPPQAKSSLSNTQKLDNPQVQVSSRITIKVYVIVSENGLVQLFEQVRYWVLVGLPVVLGLTALVLGRAPLAKAVRRRRRRRWALRRGRLARVLAPYAELRDLLIDLNLANSSDTPLLLTRRFVQDDEHSELAWLVTRVLWGDLRRAPADEDVEVATRLCASVRKRALRTQTGLARALGAVSRSSLRSPYTDVLPNFWVGVSARAVLGGWRRSTPRVLLAPLRWLLRVQAALRSRPATGVVVLLALLLGGCSNSAPGSTAAPATYPGQIVPSHSLLGLTFTRDQSAEAKYRKAGAAALTPEGQVYVVRSNGAAEGSVQVALFKPGVDTHDPSIRAKTEAAIGGGVFGDYRIGTAHLRRSFQSDQVLYLWFPPERNAMILTVLRKSYSSFADVVLRDLIATERALPELPMLAGSGRELASSSFYPCDPFRFPRDPLGFDVLARAFPRPAGASTPVEPARPSPAVAGTATAEPADAGVSPHPSYSPGGDSGFYQPLRPDPCAASPSPSPTPTGGS